MVIILLSFISLVSKAFSNASDGGKREKDRDKVSWKENAAATAAATHRVALPYAVVTPEETSVGRHGNTRAPSVTLTFGARGTGIYSQL